MTRETDLADLRKRILAIHRDGGESQGYFGDHYGEHPHCCTECGTFGEYGVAWPCATVRALGGPVRPEEPKEFGARVTADGEKWVRAHEYEDDEAPWLSEKTGWLPWAELPDPITIGWGGA